MMQLNHPPNSTTSSAFFNRIGTLATLLAAANGFAYAQIADGAARGHW